MFGTTLHTPLCRALRPGFVQVLPAMRPHQRNTTHGDRHARHHLPPKEKKLSGQAYLANYGLPQFFFHVTTAYDILRHNGLPIGKRDYMGAY